MVETTQLASAPRACVKRRYPNQGIALRTLRDIQRLGLPHNRQQRAYWCDSGCGAWHLTSQPLREAVELDGDAAKNLMYELKTYESVDVARAAVFVAAAVAVEGGTAAVDDLAARWIRRYPRHAEPGAKKAVRTRLWRGLRALAAVGIVKADETVGAVTVLDLAGLQMIGTNLEILEDRDGFARRPSKWPRSPEVPAHLRAVQASVVAAGVVSWKRVGRGLAAVTSPATVGASVVEGRAAHAVPVAPSWFARVWRRLVERLPHRP
jgi:hypothetical protein